MTREALVKHISGLLGYANTKTLKHIFRILIKSIPPEVWSRFMKELYLEKIAKNKKVCSETLTGPNVCAIIEQNIPRRMQSE